MKLTISQFAIEPDIGANKNKMLSVLQSAGRNEWIIFPEGALSGYFPDRDGYFEKLDRAELANAMTEIADEVKRCGCYCLCDFCIFIFLHLMVDRVIFSR